MNVNKTKPRQNQQDKIKTKPTTMADDEFEVNIHLYNFNMNILPILYFVKILFLERLQKHHGSRNLRDDNDLDGKDEVTQMLFRRSVLVHMGLVSTQMKGIGGCFQILCAFL